MAQTDHIPIASGPLNGSARAKSDAAAGFDIQENFQQFNQKDDVFRRSWWDKRIRSEKAMLFYATYREPLKTWRKADGFTQKDFALRNAAWHVSDIFTELKEDQDRREHAEEDPHDADQVRASLGQVAPAEEALEHAGSAPRGLAVRRTASAAGSGRAVRRGSSPGS